MANRAPRMISLGYGKWVRADRVYALVPIGADERGDGRRTYVHVEGAAEPLVASRSERAILADLEAALAESAGVPRRRRSSGPGQGGVPGVGPRPARDPLRHPRQPARARGGARRRRRRRRRALR